MSENNTPSVILTGVEPVQPAAPAPEPGPDLAAVSEADFKAQMDGDFTHDELHALADGEAAHIGQYDTPRPPEGFDEQSLAADLKLRGWLAGMKFPAGHGSHLAHEIGKAGERFKAMPEPERELWQRSETARLEQLWGEKTQDNLKLAQRLVGEIEAREPGFVELLEITGAGNSVDVIAAMHQQAERLVLRSAKN